MKFAESSMTIKWHGQVESLLSGKRISFGSSPVIVDAADHSVDQLLGASGASFYLRQAFEWGMSRSDVWEIDPGIPMEQQKAFDAAAKVYKRGVRTHQRQKSHASPVQPSSGQTSIFFCNSVRLFLAIGTLTKDSVLFIDQNVHDNWWPYLPYDSSQTNVHIVKITEHGKTLEAASSLYSLLRGQVSSVVIIGGGVLGDVAGFAAAQKNLPTIYIPTTLLAMVDSSIGGKTGVNFPPYGKNQVGRFHPPTAVLISSQWLQTLPARDVKAGISEALKHALLKGDISLWKKLITVARDQAWHQLNDLLHTVLSIKADVVARDPWEQGERAVLNFGHTLGHALEALSHKVDGDSALNHGEAVALGLYYALGLSHKYAGFEDADTFQKDLVTSGVLPKLSSGMWDAREELMAYLGSDKKNTPSSSSEPMIQWILLKAPGQVARAADGAWTTSLTVEQSLDLSLLHAAAVLPTNAVQ